MSDSIRRFVSLVLIPSLALATASPTFAHPGDMDANDCHTCYEDCEAWNLEFGEYHCHGTSSDDPMSKVVTTVVLISAVGVLWLLFANLTETTPDDPTHIEEEFASLGLHDTGEHGVLDHLIDCTVLEFDPDTDKVKLQLRFEF